MQGQAPSAKQGEEMIQETLTKKAITWSDVLDRSCQDRASLSLSPERWPVQTQMGWVTYLSSCLIESASAALTPSSEAEWS